MPATARRDDVVQRASLPSLISDEHTLSAHRDTPVRRRAFSPGPVPVRHRGHRDHHAPGRWHPLGTDGQLLQLGLAGPAPGALEPGHQGQQHAGVFGQFALRHQCAQRRSGPSGAAVRQQDGKPFRGRQLPPLADRAAGTRWRLGLVRVP